MLNTELFLERLEEIMENNQLNAAAFAERIGVQRSSVSHILSRRNKPSLDFMLKIHNHFRGVDLEWLLLGNKKHISSTPLLSPPLKSSEELFNQAPIPSPGEADITPGKVKGLNPVIKNQSINEIVQIIQLHKDGTFSVYIPNS